MDTNKVLIKLYVPKIEAQYDVWIPINRRIYNVVLLLIKGINELYGDNFNPKDLPTFYNKITSEPYDINAIVGETNIKNGTEIILI